MNLETLRSIASNPAASQREREAARERLAELAPDQKREDVVIASLLAQTGMPSLADVSYKDLRLLSKDSDPSMARRIERIHGAMLDTRFWSEYLGSPEERKRLARLLYLLGYDADTEEKGLALAEKKLSEAHRILREEGAE